MFVYRCPGCGRWHVEAGRQSAGSATVRVVSGPSTGQKKRRQTRRRRWSPYLPWPRGQRGSGPEPCERGPLSPEKGEDRLTAVRRGNVGPATTSIVEKKRIVAAAREAREKSSPERKRPARLQEAPPGLPAGRSRDAWRRCVFGVRQKGIAPGPALRPWLRSLRSGNRVPCHRKRSHGPIRRGQTTDKGTCLSPRRPGRCSSLPATTSCVSRRRLAAECAADPAGANARYRGNLLEVSGRFARVEQHAPVRPPARPHLVFATEGCPVRCDLLGSPTPSDRWQTLAAARP